MKVRISLKRGYYDHHLRWVVEYEITTKDWPLGKSYQKWSTSKSYEFKALDDEARDAYYNLAVNWAIGILDTDDPNIAQVVEIGGGTDGSQTSVKYR